MVNHITLPLSTRDQPDRYLTISLVSHRPNLEGLQPVGDIDLYTAPVLRRHLDDLDGRAVPGVVVDMSRVHFLAVTGVHLLVEATRKAASGDRRVVLVNPSSPVRRVLQLTKCTELLDIRDNVADALAELEEPASV